MNEADYQDHNRDEGSQLTYLRKKRPGLLISAGIAASIPLSFSLSRKIADFSRKKRVFGTLSRTAG